MSDPFASLPEPELVDIRDESVSRPALERLGKALGRGAPVPLRGRGEPPIRQVTYGELRTAFYGPSREPAPAPEEAARSDEVLAEFERVAPYVFNSQHPGSYSYFTPPPLPMSVAGELLAQWVNQGVDVWAAGPIGALVEEEVTTWLRTLIGFGDGSWAVLTSGGVMANIMGLTVARDIHLARLSSGSASRRAPPGWRARACTRATRHTSRSRGRSTSSGSRRGCIVPSDDRFRLHAEPVAGRSQRTGRRASCRSRSPPWWARRTPEASTSPRSSPTSPNASLWLHVDAAYGGRASSRP